MDKRRNALQQFSDGVLVGNVIAGNRGICLNVDPVATLIVVTQDLETFFDGRLLKYLLYLRGDRLPLRLLYQHLRLHLFFRRWQLYIGHQQQRVRLELLRHDLSSHADQVPSIPLDLPLHVVQAHRAELRLELLRA